MKKIKKAIIVLSIILIILLTFILIISKNKNKIPPDGLGLKENIVNYNTKPLKNASTFYTVESYVRKIFKNLIRESINRK